MQNVHMPFSTITNWIKCLHLFAYASVYDLASIFPMRSVDFINNTTFGKIKFEVQKNTSVDNYIQEFSRMTGHGREAFQYGVKVC